MISQGINLDDWLLTEALRRREQQTGRWRDDETATRLARETGSALDARLAMRARALPDIDPSADLAALGRMARRFLFALVVMGTLSGWLAARASAADRQVDLLLATLTLVGLPTVMLMLWLLVWLLSGRRRATGSVLAMAVERMLAWLGPRGLDSELAPELAQSSAAFLTTRAGRWWLSLGSHLLWLAFSLGALIGLLLFFSLAQYDLSWGTTILSDRTVSTLIQGLAWVPQVLGLGPGLDMELIERGREGGLAGSDRAVWAQFLMIMVLLYVTLPRLLLLLLSWLRFRQSARAVPLDLGQPGFLRLRAELMPDDASGKLIGSAPSDEADRALRTSSDQAGRPVMFGLELDDDIDARLAKHLKGAVVYLGGVSRRAQRRALVEALEAMRPPPSDLLVICSLLRTPDAGTARFIDHAADVAESALIVIGVDGHALGARGGNLQSRQRDWRRLAERVGGGFHVLDEAEGCASAAKQIEDLIITAEGER